MAGESLPNGDLFFISHNPSASTSVVLLHGLFSSHLEWEFVAPHLGEYHLVIPDLPQHSRSRHIAPFSLALAAEKVASLIEKHAKGGRAHVVGLSLGGFITMETIRRYPALVLSGFVSGSSPFHGWQMWAAERPSLVYYSLRAMFGILINLRVYLVYNWSWGLLLNLEMINELSANLSPELSEASYLALREWQHEAVKEVGLQDVRILAVAGGKQDDVEGIREMGRILRSLGRIDGRESCAFVVKNAVHGWDLQFPELFANGVLSWIEKETLPAEYVALQ